MAALIELNGVSYAYPLASGKAIEALQDISLRIREGEYVAIVGANGSGKSTLARHLNALLIPTTGQVRVSGLDTRNPQNHAEIRRAVGMVFQRPMEQLIATVVEEDVAFGPENLGLPPAQIRQRVRESLEIVGLWDERARPPHMLSAGQMQRLALAGVLAMRPRCIVFDEATAMLDPAGRRAVRDMMVSLHHEGLTVITITHFMEEVVDAGRVIVLHQGRVALDAPPYEAFTCRSTLSGMGLDLPPVADLACRLGERLPALPHDVLTVSTLVEALEVYKPQNMASGSWRTGGRPAPTHSGAAMSMIAVQGLGHTYMEGTPLARRALKDVALTVAEDEAHGLLGATGSGKSTLLQHLNGLLRPHEGTVYIAGFDLSDPDVDVKAVRRLAGLSFQMPEMQIFEQYVGDEIAYGPKLLAKQRPDLPLQREELRKRVRWAMQIVGLDFERYKDRLTFTLSGGEKRKVALASTLAMRPRILLLDEPTAGLDPVSRLDLLDRLKALHTGMTLVLSTHQMDDLVALSDSLTVLDDGQTVLSGGVREVFAQSARLRALGLDTPLVMQVAEALQARGWPLAPDLIRADELVAQISQIVIM